MEPRTTKSSTKVEAVGTAIKNDKTEETEKVTYNTPYEGNKHHLFIVSNAASLTTGDYLMEKLTAHILSLCENETT